MVGWGRGMEGLNKKEKEKELMNTDNREGGRGCGGVNDNGKTQ